MLSWVREKLSEGRSRWQQGLQQQRNTRSPPPLPPPSVIESPVSTPVGNPSGSIDTSDSCISEQPATYINNLHPNANLILQLQENTVNSTKPKNSPYISRRDQWSSISHQTPTSIVINRRANDSSVRYLNLRIFNCFGSKCTIYAPITITFADVKRKVIAEFFARRQLFVMPYHKKPDCMPSSSRDWIEEQKLNCDNVDLVQLSQYYKLARINKLHDNFDESSSLAMANVENNEEMLLVFSSNNATAFFKIVANTKEMSTVSTINKASADSSIESQAIKRHFNCDSESDSDENDATNNSPLTQLDIDLATSHLLPKNIRGPNVINIDELIHQSDVQYDIRKILISLAYSCAYVIGSGPYAKNIIVMLKQRLIQRKQHEQDTQQCLIEMGFSRSKVQHALNINNNVYATALEWLIENQSPTNPLLGSEQSSAMNLSSKFTNNASVKDNIESLLEIIRIYCQRDLPPPTEMIQFIVGMGFDEATAHEALKITKNHQSNACEWLVGDRSKINQVEQSDGLPNDSPILAALINSPHIQLSLSNPKMFIAYLSILEDYGSIGMWMNDSETSSVIGQILRTYHEEKHVMAINQFSQ